MLPHKDGFSIGKEIKEINPLVPIIYLTAKTQVEDVLKGFESGGNDYLRKPFSMEELIVRINYLISNDPSTETISHSEKITSIASFSFDPTAMELRHEIAIVKLSHRENELLKLLSQYHNDTIERSLILKTIWGDDHFFNSRNLDVYIRKLRGHLALDPTVQIITLKGTGYRFVY